MDSNSIEQEEHYLKPTGWTHLTWLEIFKLLGIIAFVLLLTYLQPYYAAVGCFSSFMLIKCFSIDGISEEKLVAYMYIMTFGLGSFCFLTLSIVLLLIFLEEQNNYELLGIAIFTMLMLVICLVVLFYQLRSLKKMKDFDMSLETGDIEKA